VEVTGIDDKTCTWVVEPEELNDFQIEESLLSLYKEENPHIVVVNSTGFTQTLPHGTTVGKVVECSEVTPTAQEDLNASENSVRVHAVMSHDEIAWRQQKLQHLLKDDISNPQRDELHPVLLQYHDVFSLSEDDRGETDIVQMTIDTGNALPQRQRVRRIPVAARQEVAKLLSSMQKSAVIQPSSSPWASPVVLVKKKNGTLRFCVDYRKLNSVTKADSFPLPRIDDILDQLGQSKCFTTLDLKSGYWQVQIHPDSRDKTAFITHEGLYEFRVMPFGLMNAPASFQRLMQRVFADLMTEEQQFIAVYLDDVLIFSPTLEDHKVHLCKVLDRLREVGLKLNPSKCHFVCDSVQYLGHLITPDGLKPMFSHITAIQKFPVPQDIKALRQFLGLASFYRRFILNFAKIADPLHKLTRKNVPFEWSSVCQTSFDVLKNKLVMSPVLAYPDFSRNFCIETDASAQGLGAILSQIQNDGARHPVAYASRALSSSERNYSITDLETLAVVWAISHFHHYLYGHHVTVLTDHLAVLEDPSKNGKHAQRWNQMNSSGLLSVQIIHHGGRESLHADAVSI